MSKKVTFTLPAEIVGNATSALLLGDFNNWDQKKGESLKKQKDGSFTAELSLEAGKTYQYRYLLNDGRWVNDYNAGHYVHDSKHNVHNCAITVPSEDKKEVKPKEVKEKVAAAPAKEKVTAAPAKEKAVKAAPAKKAPAKK